MTDSIGGLTSLSTRMGCASKLAPLALDEVLGQSQPLLRLVGDAVEFSTPTGSAMVGSVDFGSAIVDDPEVWARIALANSLSDIYAVGSRPLFAMALLGWPSGFDRSMAARLVRETDRLLAQHSIVFGGGHSIVSSEPLYGFAVVGEAASHPMSKAAFCIGDDLVLTKRIGGGVLLAAEKIGGHVTRASINSLWASMQSFNDAASRVALEANVKGCTDVSGYGLLGSCFEVAEASHVCIELDRSDLPRFEGSQELIENGLVPTRCEETHLWLQNARALRGSRDLATELLMCSPETSGGLLIGVPSQQTSSLLTRLDEVGAPGDLVGRVRSGPTTVRLVCAD
jgi:selenide,water dikinase